MYGQALDLTIDLNTPASKAPQFSEVESLDVDAALGFSLGYFSRPAVGGGPPLRMGIIVGRQGLSVRPSGSTGSTTKFNAFRVQGRADLRFLGNENLNLSGGLALGLSFMSDTKPCNEMFCDLPSSVVLVTPSLRATVRISSKVSGIVDARWSVYMTDRNSTFPYKSGGIMAVGVELAAGPSGGAGDDF